MSKRLLLVACYIFYIVGLNVVATTNPIVSAPLGKYEGTVLTSRLGKSIFSFRGIRYAEPPLNELRFKPPVGIKKHEGVYNATEDAPVCPQPTRDPVSEDCMFLNVYTTKLPKKGANPKRPVIVHIHAGGFYSGNGRSNWAGPQYLMDEEIVLVTFNYRLGALGFLSTGDKEAPGNNGLRDQVVVLKWIKQNIEAFGGDPNSVTLYGYSAGSTSVHFHLMSPMSKGLFHKVIFGSASPLGQWPIGNSQLDLAKRQARILGCPDQNSSIIVECLKGKSADEIGRSLPDMKEFGTEPVLLWKPVIEKEFGQERFLTDHPMKLVRQGKFQKIPMLSGITTDEFSNSAYAMVNNAELLQQLDENWDKNGPIVFQYERGTERSKVVGKEIRNFYLGSGKLDNSSLSAMTKLYADAQTGWGINRAVKLFSEKNTDNVYYYKFSFKGRYSHFYLPGTKTAPYVVHHDDLIYLFYISTLFPKFGKTDPESPTVDKMITMWANFARTGKPIPETCGRLDFAEWEPFNLKTQKYMDIGSKLQMSSKLFADRYAKWEELYPLSMYDNPHFSQHVYERKDEIVKKIEKPIPKNNRGTYAVPEIE